jgi:hypothetical protein
MTRDYSSRGQNRACYLVAGQPGSHTTPYRVATTLRPGGLPNWLPTPRHLDFLDPGNPYFVTDRALHSSGHYIGRATELPPGTFSRRLGNTIMFDSGGLQFGRMAAAWKGDASRAWALNFLEAHADEAISLDIPTRTITPGVPPFDSFASVLNVTLDNNHYFARHRASNLRLLCVLQGENRADALAWLNAIKVQPFEGWAFGGTMRTDFVHVVDILLRLIADGLLGPERNRLHFLGVSSLKTAVMLTAIQRALREYLLDDELLITFDTSTPATLTTNGNMFGYANLSPTSSGHVHVGWRSPFPFQSSRISEVANLSDLCLPAATRQHGWDALGVEIVNFHNTESLLRGIADANSVMELPSVSALRLAPEHVIRTYRALRTMFTHADPLAHVRRFNADFDKL